MSTDTDAVANALVQSLRGAASALHFTADATIEIHPLDLDGSAAELAPEFFDRLHAAFPELKVVVSRVTASATGKVLVECAVDGVLAAPFYGFDSLGHRLVSRQAWRLDVDAAGAVTAARAYWCRNEMALSLGAAKTYEAAIA